MIIQVKQSRWFQDLVVSDLIKHMDAEERYENWNALTRDEIRVIEGEIRKCRDDFVYAARNYFWITNKGRGEQLFSLWPAQELLYEKMLELKGKGKSQKIITIKSRQLGALDPQTKVLTANMTWTEIDKLSPGEEAISFDENPVGGSGASRKFRTATILQKWDVVKDAYRITFDDGSSITATADHPFLCQARGAKHSVWMKVNEKREKFKDRSPIRVGDKIRRLCEKWESMMSFEDGWMSGMLDGEGSLRSKSASGIELGLAQVDGLVLRSAADYLKKNGYNYKVEADRRESGTSSKLGSQVVYKLTLNNIPDVFRLLGETHPLRFFGRKPWEGKGFPNNKHRGWATVVSIENIGPRRMVDISTTTQTFIAEGLATHNCSTLIEGLIAWRSIFFMNINALVISYDKEHARYLFDIMATIYDKLPWWLKPRYSSRTFDSGLIFDNPVGEMRRLDPGTQSRVSVKGANAITGVGQGYRLSAVHASEFCDWEPYKARDIIEEDLTHALHESPETFAILESTAKGANNYSHNLWKRNVALLENAEWLPVFLPWFFDEDHKRVYIPGQRFDQHMVEMRKRIITEWVRCNNYACERYFDRYYGHVDIAHTPCPRCNNGVRKPVLLADEQMAWMQHKRDNAGEDEDAQKKLAQEQSSTSEESFQVTGYQVFGKVAQDFANTQVRKPLVHGFFDKQGIVHAVSPDPQKRGHCINEGCEEDHQHDFCPLEMWELPDIHETYYIGADVAEGLGADYSVGVVLRLNKGGVPGPTHQAAMWRSNTVNPQDFAEELNWLGRTYNTCQISVELNKYDTTATWLRMTCQYPDLYRWKHMDSVNIMSTKIGWVTNQISRPRLWHNFRRFLEYKLCYVRSTVVSEEMKNFVKDDFDDQMVGHDENTKDDSLMAFMICLWCAYEGMLDESRGYIPLFKEQTQEDAEFKLTCKACGLTSYLNNIPEEGGDAIRCESCKSIRCAVERNKKQLGFGLADPHKMLEDIYGRDRDHGGAPEYFEL